MMKTILGNGKVLVVWAVIFTIHTFMGCRTKYVNIPDYHREYATKADTNQTVDSVFVKDSVFIYKNGDTMIITKVLYRDRYRNIYRIKTDTLLGVDSIRALDSVAKGKELSAKDAIYIKVGKFFFWLLCLVMVILSIVFVQKHCSHRD